MSESTAFERLNKNKYINKNNSVVAKQTRKKTLFWKKYFSFVIWKKMKASSSQLLRPYFQHWTQLVLRSQTAYYCLLMKLEQMWHSYSSTPRSQFGEQCSDKPYFSGIHRRYRAVQNRNVFSANKTLLEVPKYGSFRNVSLNETSLKRLKLKTS